MSIDTQIQLFQLNLKIQGGGKSITETYNLRKTTPTEAVTDAEFLAHWRASTLALGCKVLRAIVVVKGGAPNSWSAISRQLLGMQGVYSQQSYKSTVNLNTLSTGIEIRQETAQGDHITRLYRGLPDWTVNAGELNIGNLTDLTSMFNEPLIVAPDELPLQTVYPYDNTLSPEATGTGTGNPLNNGYVTYNEAVQKFLQAVGALTCFARYGNYIPNPDNPSSPNKGYQVQTWKKAVIQGAKDKAAKRP